MADANKVLLDRLPTLRVVDLREELKARGLSCAGVKAELSDRLKAELERAIGESNISSRPQEITPEQSPKTSSSPQVQRVDLQSAQSLGHGQHETGTSVGKAEPSVEVVNSQESVSISPKDMKETDPLLGLENSSMKESQTEEILPVPAEGSAAGAMSIEESTEKLPHASSQPIKPLVTDPKVSSLKISDVQSQGDTGYDHNSGLKGANLTEVWSESVAGKDSPKVCKVPISDSCIVGDGKSCDIPEGKATSAERSHLNEAKDASQHEPDGTKDLQESSDSESNESESDHSSTSDKHEDSPMSHENEALDIKQEKPVEKEPVKGNRNRPSPKNLVLTDADMDKLDLAKKQMGKDDQMMALNADASDLDDDKAMNTQDDMDKSHGSSVNESKISTGFINEDKGTTEESNENIPNRMNMVDLTKDVKEEKSESIPVTVPFKSLKKIMIGRKTETKAEIVEDSSRKRKWKRQSSINISSYVLKDLVPKNIEGDSEMVSVKEDMEDTVLDLQSENNDLNDEAKLCDNENQNKKDRHISASISPPAKKDKSGSKELEKMIVDKTAENKENEVMDNDLSSTIDGKEPKQQKIIAITRTIPNLLLDKPVEPSRPPSPAQNPTTAIVHVRGLVRPFTLKQLKTLLSLHGELVDDGFWIDQIKSHCYVTYQADESAKAAREALHGAKWPSCNPRELRVDFATQNDIMFARGDLSAKQPPPEVKKEEKISDKRLKSDRERPDAREKERGRDRAAAKSRKDGAVREWDIGKTDRSPSRRSRSPRGGRQHSPHHRSRSRSRNKRRSRENENGNINAEGNKKTEQPAKLLDDLFRKTASPPSIYWLPLTEEQANIRREERKKREIEQKKMRDALLGGPPAMAGGVGSGRRGSISPRRRRW